MRSWLNIILIHFNEGTKYRMRRRREFENFAKHCKFFFKPFFTPDFTDNPWFRFNQDFQAFFIPFYCQSIHGLNIGFERRILIVIPSIKQL